MKKLYILFFILFLCIGIFAWSQLTPDFLQNPLSNIPYHVIAHSGGGINSRVGLNSLESYENGYNNGIKQFDADLLFTKDNILVLRHDWNDELGTENNHLPMTYDEFINRKIYKEYTPLSFENVLDFMKEHDDIYLFCDVKYDSKSNEEKMIKAYQFIVNKAKEKKLEYLLDHLVVSFYKFEDYQKIKEIFAFKHYAIRKYDKTYSTDEILKFAKENKIEYVNLYEKYYNKFTLSAFHNAGIKVILAVIDQDKVCKYAKLGVDGIVSNYVTESEFLNCLK